MLDIHIYIPEMAAKSWRDLKSILEDDSWKGNIWNTSSYFVTSDFGKFGAKMSIYPNGRGGQVAKCFCPAKVARGGWTGFSFEENAAIIPALPGLVKIQ